jgi:SAM-dependent methyltransferase
LTALLGPAWRPGGLTLTRETLAACGFEPGARIVDVACGHGATLGLLAELGFEAHGLDLNPAAAAQAQAAAGRPASAGDMAALPWPSNWADGLFCECALSLARDRAATLAEFRRVLKPGGRLALSDLALRQTPALAPNMPPGLRPGLKADPAADSAPDQSTGPAAKRAQASAPAGGWLTAEALKAALEAAGFEVFHWQDRLNDLRSLAGRLLWHGGGADLPSLLACRPGGCSAGPSGGPRDCPHGQAGPPPALTYVAAAARKR